VRQRYGQYLKTFGEGLAELVQHGRIHGSFNISQAITGRASSSKPNLQNMPNGNGFRSLFVAPEGKQLVCADYSQIEVRVGGLLADEPVIAQSFAAGHDFHTATAAKMTGKPYDQVTKAERKAAKAITFGMQYGMGIKSLAHSLKVSESEAEKLVRQWEQAYPRVAEWRQQQAETGTKTRELRTAGGRRIALPPRPSPSVCYNYPVQGSAGDVMYAALAQLQDRLQAVPSARLLLVVHDEVLVECDEGDAQSVCRIVEQAMAAGYRQIFPQADCTGLVDAASGKTWEAAK
jgi:DNA polymerase-1